MSVSKDEMQKIFIPVTDYMSTDAAIQTKLIHLPCEGTSTW